MNLILLCFIFHSTDLLKLTLNSHSQKGVGEKEGYRGEGMAFSSLPPLEH